ncbi:hypothetical protein KA111_00335 [Candidatus Woesebacteria bacterium]|nr:hypothetical protein [Candidatus Woesebacteria bacterium]
MQGKKEELPATEGQLKQIADFLHKEVEELTVKEVEEVGGQATLEEQQHSGSA